mmetsp:Transcript_11260/g.26569  ORF Transcript_11260/g.26569 Transcript_11260/m.26569 type:complete len:422 (-) Transcript_11260:672-1937(-)
MPDGQVDHHQRRVWLPSLGVLGDSINSIRECHSSEALHLPVRVHRLEACWHHKIVAEQSLGRESFARLVHVAHSSHWHRRLRYLLGNVSLLDTLLDHVLLQAQTLRLPARDTLVQQSGIGWLVHRALRNPNILGAVLSHTQHVDVRAVCSHAEVGHCATFEEEEGVLVEARGNHLHLASPAPNVSFLEQGLHHLVHDVGASLDSGVEKLAVESDIAQGDGPAVADAGPVEGKEVQLLLLLDLLEDAREGLPDPARALLPDHERQEVERVVGVERLDMVVQRAMRARRLILLLAIPPRLPHALLHRHLASTLEVDDADGVEKKSSFGGALGEGRGQRRLEYRQHVRKVPADGGELLVVAFQGRVDVSGRRVRLEAFGFAVGQRARPELRMERQPRDWVKLPALHEAARLCVRPLQLQHQVDL